MLGRVGQRLVLVRQDLRSNRPPTDEVQDVVSPLVAVGRVGVVRDQDDQAALVVDADAAHVADAEQVA